MRLSRYLLPVLKETPAEAEIVSHRLMLRAGMIRQAAAGIYNWLPLGLRALRKIERIVREEQDRSGAIELLMPTLQQAELWRESGRYDDYGPEMLRMTDRHERGMLFGPTHEEQVTDIFRNAVRSYRDLPLNLYQIQWKFRDERRPRFGVMRGREFLMKDNYSFDLDEAGARHSYNKMFVAYLRTFHRIGLKAIPMRAEAGPIGGDLSHEFIVLAPTGESAVFYDRRYEDFEVPAADVDYDGDLQPIVDHWTQHYAATEDMHEESAAAGAGLVHGRGIEVGHIFFFGTKYSEPMGATVQGPEGASVPVQMGSYGIGVSRLVGAVIEASHDEAGIVWPEAVAPFRVGLVNLRSDDADCTVAADDLYDRLRTALGEEVLYDDRPERAGAKFAAMDLIGLPFQLMVGPRGLKSGIVELKDRATGVREELSPESALARLSEAE